MKQKLKRFMAGFMAMLTLVGTLFTNGTTAFAASPQANIAFWNASVKNSGEVSELKPGYNHGKILYSILDGNSAYCMNFGLRADGGQLMNSYDDASTSMSAQQRKLLSYCLYYGFNSTQKAAPSNSQCDEYIATQAMVWVIVADIFGTGSGDSAARKLCNTAPSPDSSYSYYERLRDNISSSYNATLPSFASRRTSEAPTYELKWNEGSQRFEATLSDSNGVLSDFDFGISGYSVIDADGKLVESWISEAGKTHMIERLPVGKYTLREESAPYGYKVASDVTFEVKETAEIQKVSMKDEQVVGKIVIEKTDKVTGKPIEGVVFEVRDKDGKVLDTLTTDKNGHAESKELPICTYNEDGTFKEDIHYTVVETKAADGYILDETAHDVTLRYDDNAPDVVVTTLKLINVPTEPKLPQTGDNANPLLYLGIGALALITGVGVGLRGRKKKNKQ